MHYSLLPEADFDTQDRVEIRFPSTAITIVEIVGQRGLAETAPLEEALETAVARRGHILVDLSLCSAIDAALISRLRHGQAATTASGGRFALIIPMSPGPVGRVADVMSMAQMFPVYSSLEHAVASTRDGDAIAIAGPS